MGREWEREGEREIENKKNVMKRTTAKHLSLHNIARPPLMFEEKRVMSQT